MHWNTQLFFFSCKPRDKVNPSRVNSNGLTVKGQLRKIAQSISTGWSTCNGQINFNE